MSDNETGQVSAGPNKMVIALLAVVVVLLGVIVAIVVLKPAAKTVTPGTGTTTDGSTATTPTGMGAGSTAAYDPATATRLGEGETPATFVESYFKELVAGDFEGAYNRLPTAKKAAQDAAGFASQLKSYGITGYTMGETTVNGADTVVSGTAITGSGNFEYIWTFTKVDSKWVVKGRELGGMGGS
jgi:hypothetical protein